MNEFVATLSNLNRKLNFGKPDAIMFSMLVHQLAEKGMDCVVRQRNFFGQNCYSVECDALETGIVFDEDGQGSIFTI